MQDFPDWISNKFSNEESKTEKITINWSPIKYENSKCLVLIRNCKDKNCPILISIRKMKKT